MSLLKILYFAHAWHLVKYNSALVGQPFEAWNYGPVNRVVYEQVRNKKKIEIFEPLLILDPCCGVFIEARADFGRELSEFLENIFDYYARFDGIRLSDLTHEIGSPWDQIWQKAAKGAVAGMIIPNELIRTWFANQKPPSGKRH